MREEKGRTRLWSMQTSDEDRVAEADGVEWFTGGRVEVHKADKHERRA